MTPLALFLVSLLCLGFWVVTPKLAGKRWRFELFAVDFAFGTLVFSILAALTLGSFASDLPFSDHLLLSSKTAQAQVLSGGFIFGLANLLLLGAVALLGVAGGFPICVGWGLIVNALLHFRSYRSGTLLAGLALFVFGVLLNAIACRFRDALPAPAARKGSPQPSPGGTGARSLKGLIVAFIGGTLLGVFYPLAEGGVYGDLGLGLFGGLLFFSAGIFVSTLVFSVVFFNIALQGPRLSISSYFRELPRQHMLGLAGGAFWAAGVLTAFLGKSAATDVPWQQAMAGFLPVGSALLAVLWGVLVFREFAAAPFKAQLSLAGTAVLLLGGYLLMDSAYIR